MCQKKPSPVIYLLKKHMYRGGGHKKTSMNFDIQIFRSKHEYLVLSKAMPRNSISNLIMLSLENYEGRIIGKWRQRALWVKPNQNHSVVLTLWCLVVIKGHTYLNKHSVFSCRFISVRMAFNYHYALGSNVCFSRLFCSLNFLHDNRSVCKISAHPVF